MSNAALLATRYARRPLLLEPGQAQQLLNHLAAQDPRGMLRETRLDAALRKIFSKRPRVQDHVDDAIEASEADADASAARRPAIYAPLWAQQAYGEPEDEGFAWSLFQGIACMEIATAISDRGEYYCGVWYHGYDTILAALREASADARVKGIFIRQNTPGGVVADGLDDVTNFMREARAAAGGKPIHVYASMSCSGGYWIGAPADRISTSRFGLVGSIGACVILDDWSEGYKKAGLKVEAIQFGEGKTDYHSWKPLSDAARAHLQGQIDQIGRDFIESVSASRPQLTPEILLDTQARVFMATNDDPALSGLQLGFVDAIESEEEAFANLLARVSTAQGAETSTLSTPPVTQSARTALSPKKETTMAVNGLNAARVAELAARRAKLEAELEQVRADETAAASTPAEGEGEEDDDETDDEGGGDGSGAGEGDDAGDEDGDKTPKVSEADAIMDSAEARAHPHAAMAAVRTGMTLAQFQAQIAAQGQAPKRGLLGQVLADAKRLGPDGKAPEASAFGSALVADAKARGGR
jgi:capsid assembly protease